MKEKAVWFTDADWLISSISQLNKSHIDPKKLMRYVKDRWQLEDAIWFTGYDPKNKGQMEFFKTLIELGYTTYYEEISKGELAKKENRYVIFIEEVKRILEKTDKQPESYTFFFKKIRELTEKMKVESNLDPMISYKLGRIPYDYESRIVILLSGDGDFVKPLWGLRESGYRITVMAFEENTNIGLWNVSHEFININSILPNIKKEKEEAKKPKEEQKSEEPFLFNI